MREEALLAQVRVLTEKHEALAAATGQNFNLFKILGRETDEVRTHSAILAELLNPNGSHGQGPVFARLFAERFDIPTEGIESAKVWCEETIGKGNRADILMQMDNTCVVVENKIYADDQPRQLERYHKYAKEWPRHKLIYLTLHGDDPSEDSLGKLLLEEVERVSYEQDVLDWLDDCIKEVARVPQIREILAHYHALLRKLTGKSTGELIVDLKNLLRSKQGDTYNFKLAEDIAKALTELSVEAEWNFWQTLKEQLRETGNRPWWLTYADLPTAAVRPSKEVDEDIIRHAHGAGKRDKWWYGLTFRIESKANSKRYYKDDCELLLRVECDGSGWCFYGFIAVDNTQDELHRLSRAEKEHLFENWNKHLSALENGWQTGDSWVAWAWPTENLPLQKSNGWLTSDAIRLLLEGQAVDSLVADIHTTINKLEGREECADSDPDKQSSKGG